MGCHSSTNTLPSLHGLYFNWKCPLSRWSFTFRLVRVSPRFVTCYDILSMIWPILVEFFQHLLAPFGKWPLLRRCQVARYLPSASLGDSKMTSTNAQGCLYIVMGRRIFLFNHVTHSITIFVDDCCCWATFPNFVTK